MEQLISNHPDFPSLLSVSDVYTRLGVHHRVTRLDKDRLAEVEYPYLLPLDKGRGDLILIDSHQTLRKSYNRLEEWSGVVVLAESTENTPDSTNNSLYTIEKNAQTYAIVAILALIALVAFSQINSFSPIHAALLATAFCGLFTGYFLVAKELGITYAAVDAFCNAGKNTNCDAVLKADISVLGIKFSDAVVSFFLFQILLLGFASFFSLHAQSSVVLAGLSLLTLPIIMFSVYYQYFIAKTWCGLCLIVVGVLVVQAGILGYALTAGLITQQVITPMFSGPVFVTGLLILVLVQVVKSTLERYEKLNQHGGAGNQVKHNARVFLSFLENQKRIDDTCFENEMIVGDPDAPIKILMVSNLYCNPCKLKHEVAAQLVAIYPESIQLTMRFVQSSKDPESVGHLLNFWHQSIKGKDNEWNKTMNLLHDWFTIWDFEKFKVRHPVGDGSQEITELEKQHYAWMDAAGIMKTPTFFVNGYEMPKEYGIEDLLMMAPALINSSEKLDRKEKQRYSVNS